jgi:hypothetical protein
LDATLQPLDRPADATWVTRLRESVLAAFAWRYLAHSLMVAMSLVCEARPGRPMADWLLTQIPYSRWLAVHNYHVWLVAYVPLALWLWRRDRSAFVSFLWLGGVLSLLRGLSIALVPLGPVEGVDVNVGMSRAELWQAFLGIVNPLSALTTDVANTSLTKDLFFSGHASSSFLLWLYCRRVRLLGALALVAHLAVVFTVLAARIHYTVDVLGAWVITYAVYRLAGSRAALPSVAPARSVGDGEPTLR